MDGEHFDSLIKRLGTTRLTRLAALRGLAVGTVAGLTGLSLTADEADADKKKPKKRPVCLCSSTSCTTKRVRNRKKAIRRAAPCAYKGKCTSFNPCAARVGCQTNADCTGGQVCVGNICVACFQNGQCSGNFICVNGQCQAPGAPAPAPVTTIINNPTTLVGLEICAAQGNICTTGQWCCTSGSKTGLCVPNEQSCGRGGAVQA
jgi:hypothetical protein